MLNLIIGNVDFPGAAMFIATVIGGTIIVVNHLNKKSPQDYEIEKLKIEKEAEKQLVAYKREK